MPSRRCVSRLNGQVQRRNMLSVDIWLSIPIIGLLPVPSKRTGKKRSVNWRRQRPSWHFVNSGGRERLVTATKAKSAARRYPLLPHRPRFPGEIDRLRIAPREATGSHLRDRRASFDCRVVLVPSGHETNIGSALDSWHHCRHCADRTHRQCVIKAPGVRY